MSVTSSREIRRLLDEAPFVDALARALAGQDAGDVVQDTWLQALTGGTGVRSPREWLACAVRGVACNLRRGRARRRAHERTAARSDLAPSAVELLERQERRRELVQAVDGLPEPLRTVVLLRWFEGLPPRRIAEHLELPVSTVSSRLRTAIAALRQRLDDRHGGRKAWLLPLPARTATAALASGVLTMTTKAKVAAAAGVLVLAALALWTLDGAPVSPPQGPGGPGQPPPLTAEVSRDPQAPEPEVERTRVATQAPAAEPATGTLVVEATYEEDGTPVRDLLVLAGRYGADQRFGRRRVRTDEQGLARIEDLAPGQWRVSNSRNWNVSAWAEVVAGAETVHRLKLPLGITVTGIVVDTDGLPVAGAQVYLKFPVGLDAEHAATTRADGRFALRSCARACSVGARAAGHAPSRMQTVLQDSGIVDLRIVLPGSGGGVGGVVLGPDGKPVPDALVLVGEGLPNLGTYGLLGGPAGPAQARTGEDGRFRAIGVPAGEQPVRVRAARLAPWEGSCRVEAHSETTLQVTLSAGLSCTGVVVDAGDAQVRHAFIQVGDPEEFAHYRTYSARNGTFRLDGLPPGEVEVRASHDRGKAAIVVRGGPGDTVACTLRLDAGLEMRGRVLTVSGAPVENAIVNVWAERTDHPPSWHSLESTDAEGRFHVTHCPAGRLLTFTVRGGSIRDARVEHVDSRAGDIEIQVEAAPPPSARITGKVVGPDGRPVPHARVTGYGPDAGRAGASGETSESGAFELGPLVPGRWLVAIDAEDLPGFSSGWREVPPESVQDLGTIHLPLGGTVLVRLAGAGELEPRLSVGDATLSHWAAVYPEGDVRRSEPVAPGPHYVSVRGKGVARQLVPVEVRACQESEIEVRIQAGHRQRFRFIAPSPPSEMQVRITRGAKLVADSRHRASLERPGPVEWERWLAPGDYTITARGDGLSGRAAFTVRAGDNEVVRVALR